MTPGEGLPIAEFDLVLACVRWPIQAVDAARIRDLAQQPIHWGTLVDIVQHHHVSSLVFRNLEAHAADWVPVEPLAALRSCAVANARICFQLVSELVRLARLFREQQIDLRVFKGAPLAISAFGDPTLRGIGDLDFLVRERDVVKAEELLQSQGYLRCEPNAQLTPRRMRSYVEHQKDFSYENPRNGVAIDLHWRLFRNPWMPANATLEEAGATWVQLGPENIPTLPLNRHFLYLCVHGALDGWLRLKWLADIGALLRKTSPVELDSIAQAAIEWQVLPEFSAALLLCRQRLGFEGLPAACLDEKDRTVSHILRYAHRLMGSNAFRPLREQVPSTTWFVNEFSLHSSLQYRMELFRRSLFRPRVWHEVNLPDWLFPLYALLSPVEWISFRIQRLFRRLKPLQSDPPLAAAGRRESLFLRFFQLSSAEVGCLVEALTMLIFFRAALRFVPMQRLTAWMGGQDPNLKPFDEPAAMAIVRRIEWAVGAITRHAPLRFVCFPQSLAAYFMLRRRKIHSKLFYGVAREEHHLTAHTWIKVGDRTVIGGETESRFTVLAIFP